MRAVVNAPICPLMSDPRPDCALADEALFGMEVEVLERTAPDYWRVRTHYRYEGYAPTACLLPGDRAAEDWAARPKRVVLHKNTCDVLAQPKVQSWPLVSLTRGAVVAPEGEEENGWQRVILPDGREGYTRSSFLDEYYENPPFEGEDSLRMRIVGNAMRYFGTHYRWGGKSPLGIDCSGLVSMAYLLSGIIIYRDASIVDGFPIHEITLEEARPADLLFFPGHVAMYLGGGRYIHSTGKAGCDGLTTNSLNPEDPEFRADLRESLTQVGSYF